MKENFLNSLPPEKKEQTKKGLVWVFVFSITMFFAGLTSAYIVSMGDGFWVKTKFPTPFWISTVLILLSSIPLMLAVKSIKKGDMKKTSVFLVITTLLGIGFAFSQYKGYSDLIDNGAHFVSKILVTEGRYGEYYSIKQDGVLLDLDGNSYTKNGEKLPEAGQEELRNFMSNFDLGTDYQKTFDLAKYGEKYVFLYKEEPLTLVNGHFIKPNGEQLKQLEFERLTQLARNIMDERGDFFISGEMGEDFKLYYIGKELQYKNRQLYYNGQELPSTLQNKLLRGNSDTATSYLYIITGLHFLHVLCALIMLFVYTTRSLTGRWDASNAVNLKSGSIFWHFLGALWVYLLLFLLFIH